MLLTVLAAIALLMPLIYAGIEQQRFLITRSANELNLQIAYRTAESMITQVRRHLSRDGAASEKDHLGEIWAQPLPLLGADDVTVFASVTDSNRFWNLNALVDRQGAIDQDIYNLYARILTRQGLPESLLDAVIDWIDSDDQVTGIGGAENRFYRQADRGYGAKNAPLDNLDELRLLRDWDTNKIDAIRPFFTAFPFCSDAGLNINTASASALTALGSFWSEHDTRPILHSRQKKPFDSVSELNGIDSLAPIDLPKKLLSVTSNCFVTKIVSESGAVKGIFEAGFVRDHASVNIIWKKWNH